MVSIIHSNHQHLALSTHTEQLVNLNPAFFILYSCFKLEWCSLQVNFCGFSGLRVYAHVFLSDWHHIFNGSLNRLYNSSYLAQTHTHTHVIHLFMWSALWIISILHGRLMNGGHAHRPQGTQSIPSHCVVSPCLSVWSWDSMICHMATVSGPSRFFLFFLESHPVVLTLCDQTWPTHAGPRRRNSEPPG